MLANKCKRRIERRRRVAKLANPADIFFAAKPGHLALGVVAMALLGDGDGVRFGEFGAQDSERLTVTQRFERTHRTEAGEQRLGLGENSFGEHLRSSIVDARIERSACWIKADAQQTKTSECVASLGKLVRNGATRGERDLNCTHQLRRVVRMNARSGNGIKARKQAMQPARTTALAAARHASPQIVIALRAREQTLNECAEIEASATGDDRRSSSGNDGVHGGASLPRVVARGEVAVRISDVKQVMRNKRTFGSGGLGGADIQATVNGDRVATDNLGRKATGKCKCKRGFAAGCGAEQDDCKRIGGTGGDGYHRRHQPAGNHQARGTCASRQASTTSATSTRPKRWLRRKVRNRSGLRGGVE